MRKKVVFKKIIVTVLALLLAIGGVVAIGSLNKSGTIKKLEAPEMPNLLPFPYANMSGNYGGADVVVSEDGTIEITGKAEGETAYIDIVLYEGSGIELPEMVTLTANTLANDAYIRMDFNDGTTENISSKMTKITFETSGRKLTQMKLRLRVDSKPDDMIVQIMLNEGEVAYPYVPYVAD